MTDTDDTASQPDLLTERRGHVLIVTLNRPAKRNSFSAEMLALMANAWDTIDGDPEIRCAVLTGAGDTFCAGADLKAMNAPDPDNQAAQRIKTEAGLAWKALLRSHRLTKPLIAAVEGYAIAGGTEILQATDIRIAGASATFGIAEARRGLFPLGGSTVRLRRQIGYARAMEILLTGRDVPADEAERIGLINRVVPDGTALAAALEVAELIAANGPVSVQAIKRSVQETDGMTEEDGLARELEIGLGVFASEDAKEGPRAFAEKRAPVFKGR